MEGEGRDSSSAAAVPDTKPGGFPSDTITTSAPPTPHSDVYHIGLPPQRTSIVMQKPGQRILQKWKGPDKISRIYGDWIDDIE